MCTLPMLDDHRCAREPSSVELEWVAVDDECTMIGEVVCTSGAL